MARRKRLDHKVRDAGSAFDKPRVNQTDPCRRLCRPSRLYRRGGQAGGGISVIFSDTEDGPLKELKWDKWQGGEFRATTGRQLWGEKWESVLVGESDEDKVDVVFFIAVPTIWVKSAAKVEGRPLARIIPSSLLTEYQGHHWLQKGKIVRSYILKRDAEIVME